MRRHLTVIALILAVITLGGCAMQPESRIDEFLTQSQRLAMETVGRAPAEPAGTVQDEGAEVRFGDTASAEEKPTDPAWAQARAGIQYGSQLGASETGAAAIAAGLVSDGWEQSRVRETSEIEVTDGFRKSIDGDDWYVEMAWVRAAPGNVEWIEVLVVSPGTVRG